jgi:hypothetical protein
MNRPQYTAITLLSLFFALRTARKRTPAPTE